MPGTKSVSLRLAKGSPGISSVGDGVGLNAAPHPKGPKTNKRPRIHKATLETREVEISDDIVPYPKRGQDTWIKFPDGSETNIDAFVRAVEMWMHRALKAEAALRAAKKAKL